MTSERRALSSLLCTLSPYSPQELQVNSGLLDSISRTLLQEQAPLPPVVLFLLLNLLFARRQLLSRMLQWTIVIRKMGVLLSSKLNSNLDLCDT